MTLSIQKILCVLRVLCVLCVISLSSAIAALDIDTENNLAALALR